MRKLNAEQQELAIRFVPLARRISGNRSRNWRPQEHEENFSVACLGLVQAASKFDRSRGRSFITYASARIGGEITDQVRRDQFITRYARERGDVAPAFGKLPVSVPARTPPVGQGIEQADEIRNLVCGLGERSRSILMQRYRDGLTIDEVAAEQGLSPCRVSQIICAALRFLRERHKRKDPR